MVMVKIGSKIDQRMRSGSFKKPKPSARKLLPYKKKKPLIKRAAGTIGKAAVERRLLQVAREKATLSATKRAATKKANQLKAKREANKAKKAALAEKNRLAAKRKSAGKSGLLALGGAGVAGMAGKATYDLAGPKVSSAKQTYGPNIKKQTYEPKGHVVPSKSKSYSIKSGDTLSQVAKRQGTTLKALLAANPSIKDPNKIRIGQKIKMSAPVKGRKSVYQGLSKERMAGMAVKKRAAGKLVGGGVGRRLASQAVKRGTKKFIEKGGKVQKIPSQTRKSSGIQERIPSAAEKKQLRAEIKLINDKIRSLERLTQATGKGGATSGLGQSGAGSASLRGTGRKPAARVEKNLGGPIMNRQGYGDRKDESIAMRLRKKRTPAQLRASANESYGKFGRGTGKGVINLYAGGAAKTGVGKAIARAAVKRGTKKFIEKGGKITKIKETKPRADYTAGPVKRKKKSKGGEKTPFVRKAGGVIKRKNSGRVVKITKYPEHKPRKNYGKKRIGRSTAKVVRKSGGTLLVASSYD